MRYLLLVLSLALAASAQQNENKVRMEIRAVGKPIPPPPPKAEPGDSVEMDRDTGAIVATSRGLSFTFRKHNFMGPLLRVSYSAVGDQVEYLYTLANGSGSANTISSFALYLPDPAAAQAAPPSPWQPIPVLTPSAPETPPLLFARVDLEGTGVGRLSAGQQMGPFALRAPGMPGLIRVVFRPERTGPKAGEVAEGDYFFGSSPWVQARILELDTHDRHEIRTWTIGPKRGVPYNDLTTIRAEIREGAQVPEFARNAVEIVAIASLPDPAAIRSRLEKLPSTSFQKEWVQALLWRLDRIQ